MRTTIAKMPALLAALVCTGVAMLPATPNALGDTGGATPQFSSPALSAPLPSPGQPPTLAVATAVPPVITSIGPVTLVARSVTMLGHTLDFSGSVASRDAHKLIVIERYDSTQSAWVSAISTHANRHGAFLARWRTNLPGRITVRAVALSSISTVPLGKAARVDSSPPAQVTVYHPALATYFGPGFYNQKTACGQVLQPSLVGVANRTLACGTLVEISYGGHRLTVPVVDRGPYANGADWDLTSAAAAALGMQETEHIGTLIVGSVANSPTLGLPAGALSPTVANTGGSAAG